MVFTYRDVKYVLVKAVLEIITFVKEFLQLKLFVYEQLSENKPTITQADSNVIRYLGGTTVKWLRNSRRFTSEQK